jgi:hypothetical protein
MEHVAGVVTWDEVVRRMQVAVADAKDGRDLVRYFEFSGVQRVLKAVAVGALVELGANALQFPGTLPAVPYLL